MWTASRGGEGGGRAATSQLWVSRINAAAIDAALEYAALKPVEEPVEGPVEGALQP
jgi:hypothetical protein